MCWKKMPMEKILFINLVSQFCCWASIMSTQHNVSHHTSNQNITFKECNVVVAWKFSLNCFFCLCSSTYIFIKDLNSVLELLPLSSADTHSVLQIFRLGIEARAFSLLHIWLCFCWILNADFCKKLCRYLTAIILKGSLWVHTEKFWC